MSSTAAKCRICTDPGGCCTSMGRDHRVKKQAAGDHGRLWHLSLLADDPQAKLRIGMALLVRIQSIMKKRREGKPSRNQEPRSPSPETLREHRRLKTSSWKHLRNTRLLVILSSPLIYACVFPFLLLDAAVVIYQLVCFPIYGIPKVRRKDHLVFDRGRLAYLNTIEKVGCIYCSYVNGLLALITESAARSEQYCCPIKHAHSLVQTHSRYAKFLPYGDAQAYRAQSDAVARAYTDLAQESSEPRAVARQGDSERKTT